jgi:hypothetical protein
MDPRDPRARRYMDDDEEEESKGSVGKSLGIIVLMFALGGGAAFGYFKISTPKAGTNTTSPPASTTPAASPKPGGTPTPKPSGTATPAASRGGTSPSVYVSARGGVFVVTAREPARM